MKKMSPKIIRGGMQIVGGKVPLVGGIISEAAGAWSEHEQESFRYLNHLQKGLLTAGKVQQNTGVDPAVVVQQVKQLKTYAHGAMYLQPFNLV